MLYLGQGLNGNGRQRRTRESVLPPGADPTEPASLEESSRALRRGPRSSG